MTPDYLLAVLAVMTAVTYATRVSGLAAMRFVPLTPMVRDFLSGMANTVLVALVVPVMIGGDWPVRLGGAVAIAVMVATRNNLASIVAGVATVAMIRGVV
ncbi:MAG: AzlD family protein [Litorivicinus sp.]